MYIAVGGPGLMQFGLATFWFGEASFGMELGEKDGWTGGWLVRWSMG